MNLIFDVGNTATKVAVYEGYEKKVSISARHLSVEKLQATFEPLMDGIKSAIISTVRDLPEFVIDIATLGIPNVHVVSRHTRLPFKNEYETPETLGPDRLAAVAGAYYLYPGRSVLVIDAGSAVTYDFLSGKTYMGGNISPGLSMRFRALHKFTGRLPLGSTLQKYSTPGKNTLEAISAGVTDGLIFEINSYIRSFQENNLDSMIILTGGDSGYLKERICCKVNYQPDLVLDGLNHILEYNAEKN